MSVKSEVQASDTRRVDLEGVPETMLWPLWHRSYEAQRSDRLIDDPLSIQLVNQIDYDFRASFGRHNRGHGIRARYCDDLIRDFLKRYGDKSCVVALGEGLETAYWRLGEPGIPWLTVDMPESIETRKRFLPAHENHKLISRSALDFAWMDDVQSDHIPFISAAGLLMYFEEIDVLELLNKIGERFRGAELFFDAIPPSLSAKTLTGFKVTSSYTAPRMPWGIQTDDLYPFAMSLENVQDATVQTYAEPYPKAMWPYNWLTKIGPIRRAFAPSLVHVVFK